MSDHNYFASAKSASGEEVFTIRSEGFGLFEVHFDTHLNEVRIYTEEDVIYIASFFTPEEDEEDDNLFFFNGEGDTFSVARTNGLPVSLNRRIPMRFKELPDFVKECLKQNFDILAMKERA
jgi:CRISPR/Cas system CSM-associated protein Csm4 (group 5 of RAMP superfamily)